MLLSAHVAGALAAVLVFVGRRFGLASSFHLFKHIIGLLGPPRLALFDTAYFKKMNILFE